VKFTAKSFASQIFHGILSRRFACLMGLALLCAATLSAQVTFVGAQQTVLGTGLLHPLGTAVDSSGNLYIADTGNNRILKIAPNGTQTPVSVTPLTLNAPQALAFDSAGDLYISDGTNGRVVKVPVAGGAATAFATVASPKRLAVDASGNVFVVNSSVGSIVKITSGGTPSNFATGLEQPLGVAVDAAGNVYLADRTNSGIVKYPPNGVGSVEVGTALSAISGVAVDRAGNVYVAESGDGAALEEITTLGVESALTRSVNAANYLAVDSN
jgi:sugar lactone lactonase YvrE